MRWKTLLVPIVLNIFLLLSVELLSEYLDLHQRFATIEDTVQEALDSAISSAVGSEELFTSKYQEDISSYGVASSSQRGVGTTEGRSLVWVEDEGKFAKVNTYLLAKYYELYGRLPLTQADINTLNSYDGGSINGQTGDIYTWLYGEHGTDYADDSLRWANRNYGRVQEYKDTYGLSRGSMSADFEDYYNAVGKYQLTTGYLKTKEGTNSFEMKPYIFPTLINMGFRGMHPYNDESSLVTHDNFTSTYHVGKAVGTSIRTMYYLTPASLGVTYIPVKVLKPAFISSVDTVARLNLIGGSNVKGFGTDTARQASKWVDTNVYDNGVRQASDGGSTDRIVSDGLAQFDLDTAQVKVDYFAIDFNAGGISKDALEKVVTKVNGAVQTYTTTGKSQLNLAESRKHTLSAFIDEDNDTQTKLTADPEFRSMYEKTRNTRIVARVSVRIKVYVPYKSPLMQWMVHRFQPSNKHYSIKRYDPRAGRAVVDDEGVWYQYTTYYITSRS